MRKISVLAILLTAFHLCRAQNVDTPDEPSVWPQHAADIADSVIKAEVALFRLTHTTDPSRFIEIPLRDCDSTRVSFSKGSSYIDLYFKRDITRVIEGTAVNTIDSIIVVLHSHYRVGVPRSSYEKINYTPACNLKACSKKGLVGSLHYKAFQSKDKKRVYIYVSGGPENNRFDAIWILVNGRFYARTFDLIKV